MAANKAATAKKAPTKSEIYRHIAEETGLTRKDVAAVFAAMSVLIQKKPAVKARKGVNPFTGEEMMFKAKPASKVVKVAALKGLKDMV